MALQAYVGVPRWFPVSMLDDNGDPVTDLTWEDVKVTVQLNDEVVAALTLGPDPIIWVEPDDDTFPGLYRFQYTAAEAGMIMYLVEAYPDPTIAVPYEGAIDAIIAPLSGSGNILQTVTSQVAGGAPIPNVMVWITSDEAGETLIAGPQYSNELGVTSWMLSSGTYYVWQQKAGYSFTMPQEEVVA
jgi:hypothetical protein